MSVVEVGDDDCVAGVVAFNDDAFVEFETFATTVDDTEDVLGLLSLPDATVPVGVVELGCVDVEGDDVVVFVDDVDAELS